MIAYIIWVDKYSMKTPLTGCFFAAFVIEYKGMSIIGKEETKNGKIQRRKS